MSERRGDRQSETRWGDGADAWRGAATLRAVPAPDQPRHDARALTGDGGTALIALGDQVYTLRITRQHKLILTK